MSVSFVPVETDEEIDTLAEMASTIWNEYWPALIGQAQTDYMVENFQSRPAIVRDMAEHDYEYWLIEDETQPGSKIVGYTGGHVEPETNRFFISKIYLLKDQRGKGYSSKAIRFYDELCKDRGLDAMYLTVNKGNEMAIRAYNAKDFKTIDSVVTDIGNGFVMDDYIMERAVK